MKTLVQFESVDLDIAKAAQSKFKNHLWYLIPKFAALSLFDDEVTDECKMKMISGLEEDEIFDGAKRFKFKNFEVEANKEIRDFVSI